MFNVACQHEGRTLIWCEWIGEFTVPWEDNSNEQHEFKWTKEQGVIDSFYMTCLLMGRDCGNPYQVFLCGVLWQVSSIKLFMWRHLSLMEVTLSCIYVFPSVSCRLYLVLLSEWHVNQHQADLQRCFVLITSCVRGPNYKNGPVRVCLLVHGKLST